MMIHNTNVRPETQTHNPANQVPDRARLIVGQAQAWTDFVLEHARMRPHSVYRKALDSIAFSLEMRARSYGVPTKLAGTSNMQHALATLHDLNPMRGHRLGVQADGDGIVVAFSDMTLGRIQDKHVPWLRPLLAHGAAVYFLTVTGTARAEGYLGCNVAIAHAAAAIERLGTAGGDGAATAPPVPDDDVLLWREPDGTARSNVVHFPHHSPTGINWGGHGAGCADLARSVLIRFVGKEEADRLYQQFKRDVISQFDYPGGRLSAASVRSWLARHRTV